MTLYDEVKNNRSITKAEQILLLWKSHGELPSHDEIMDVIKDNTATIHMIMTHSSTNSRKLREALQKELNK